MMSFIALAIFAAPTIMISGLVAVDFIDTYIEL